MPATRVPIAINSTSGSTIWVSMSDSSAAKSRVSDALSATTERSAKEIWRNTYGSSIPELLCKLQNKFRSIHSISPIFIEGYWWRDCIKFHVVKRFSFPSLTSVLLGQLSSDRFAQDKILSFALIFDTSSLFHSNNFMGTWVMQSWMSWAGSSLSYFVEKINPRNLVYGPQGVS